MNGTMRKTMLLILAIIIFFSGIPSDISPRKSLSLFSVSLADSFLCRQPAGSSHRLQRHTPLIIDRAIYPDSAHSLRALPIKKFKMKNVISNRMRRKVHEK
jgi:hypothetical protein